MVTLISLILLTRKATTSHVYRVNGTSLDRCSKALLERDCRCTTGCSGLHFLPKVISKDANHSLANIADLQCFGVLAQSEAPSERDRAPPIVWLYGFASTTIFNLASLSGVVFAPIINKKYFPLLLSGMISLGMGSMCTASVINLIPESLGASDGNLKHLCIILASIFVFYLADQLLRFWQFDKKQGAACSLPVEDNEDLEECMSRNVRAVAQVPDARESNEQTEVSIITPIRSFRDVPIIVYMILISDGLHNFVDGLTVGAAFTRDARKALGVAIAIFFEEIPCELGDFAVFLKAGLRVKHAVLINFAGACTNYFGVIVGILIGELEKVHLSIYAIAGGMFLYISLSIMLVEMLDIQTKVVNQAAASCPPKNARRASTLALLKCIAVQNVGIILGFTIQLLVVLFGS